MATMLGKVSVYYGGTYIGEMTVVAGPVVPRVWPTDAARMIAEARPIRFPANRAGQLGNRMCKALAKLKGWRA